MSHFMFYSTLKPINDQSDSKVFNHISVQFEKKFHFDLQDWDFHIIPILFPYDSFSLWGFCPSKYWLIVQRLKIKVATVVSIIFLSYINYRKIPTKFCRQLFVSQIWKHPTFFEAFLVLWKYFGPRVYPRGSLVIAFVRWSVVCGPLVRL